MSTTKTEPAHADTTIDAAASLAQSGELADKDRREAVRRPYSAKVQLFLLTEQAGVAQPLFVHARDLSGTGISVVSKQMINPGREGVARLIRSDGKPVIIGVRVVRCCYSGEMNHETGLQFIPVPDVLAKSKAIFEPSTDAAAGSD